jgi:hypothetical protein
MRLSVALPAAILCLQLASCGDGNLWRRDFSSPPSTRSDNSSTQSSVNGYWEGEVTMGGVRARIEPARITLALKCDKDGKILSQGSASIAFSADPPARLTLLEDLSSGPDEKCGFKFFKGNEFRYRLSESGVLELNFAGSSVAQMRKLAN